MYSSKLLETQRQYIERRAFMDMTKACDANQQGAIVNALPTALLEQELIRRKEKAVYILRRTVDYAIALREREEELTLIEMEQAIADLRVIAAGKKTEKEKANEQTNTFLLEQAREGSGSETERKADS